MAYVTKKSILVASLKYSQRKYLCINFRVALKVNRLTVAGVAHPFKSGTTEDIHYGS